MTDTPDYKKYIPDKTLWNIPVPNVALDTKYLRWQAALAALPLLITQNEKDFPNHYVATHLARCAFAIADAMLKEGGYVE